jgi:hypothetical protein
LIATRKQQLHEFISALVHRGRDPATLGLLADVVAVDAVKDGLLFFIDRPKGAARRSAGIGIDAELHGVLANILAVCSEADKKKTLGRTRGLSTIVGCGGSI